LCEFSFFFIIPEAREGKQGESFQGGKIEGWHKQIVGISQYTVHISVSIKA
jgi:hypothetical protein